MWQTIASDAGNSCINRLPPELLSEIFLYLKELRCNDLCSGCPPLLLGQVCSLWRNIAYNHIPNLWTCVWLDLHRTYTEEGFVLIEDWVARARPHPLSLHISYQYDMLPPKMKPSVFAKHLLQLVGNVRSLDLELPSPYFEALTIVPSDAMPLLEKLHLSFIDDEERESTDSASSQSECIDSVHSSLSFEECFRLHTVIISCSSILRRELVVIPWSRLTRLVLDDYDSAGFEAREVLAKASTLTIFELLSTHPDGPDDDIPLLGPLSIHHHLQTLTLCLDFDDDLAQFLAIFAFPALVSLSVMEHYEDVEIAFEPLFSLQERSGFSLTTLNLSLHVDTYDLILFLRPLHNLQRLGLKRCNILDEVFVRELTCTPHKVPLVAALKRLVIIDPEMDVEDDLVLDMLESRQSSADKLEEVILCKQIDDEHHFSTFAAQRAEALKSSGLALKYPPLTKDSVDSRRCTWIYNSIVDSELTPS
jgi:F-box-like